MIHLLLMVTPEPTEENRRTTPPCSPHWPHRASRQRWRRCHRQGSTPPLVWRPSHNWAAACTGLLHKGPRPSGRRRPDTVLASRAPAAGMFSRPRCSQNHQGLKHKQYVTMATGAGEEDSRDPTVKTNTLRLGSSVLHTFSTSSLFIPPKRKTTERESKNRGSCSSSYHYVVVISGKTTQDYRFCLQPRNHTHRTPVRSCLRSTEAL